MMHDFYEQVGIYDVEHVICELGNAFFSGGGSGFSPQIEATFNMSMSPAQGDFTYPCVKISKSHGTYVDFQELLAVHAMQTQMSKVAMA